MLRVFLTRRFIFSCRLLLMLWRIKETGTPRRGCMNSAGESAPEATQLSTWTSRGHEKKERNAFESIPRWVSIRFPERGVFVLNYSSNMCIENVRCPCTVKPQPPPAAAAVYYTVGIILVQGGRSATSAAVLLQKYVETNALMIPDIVIPHAMFLCYNSSTNRSL